MEDLDEVPPEVGADRMRESLNPEDIGGREALVERFRPLRSGSPLSSERNAS